MRSNRSQGSYLGNRSINSNQSGNVTNYIRNYDRFEADINCKHNVVKVRDDQGNVVAKKVKSEKMTNFQSFFATCKSYCAINVLLTPKAFKNGGYILSPVALLIAGVLQCYCAIKLTQCGMHVKKISYPDIVFKALGKKGKKVLEIFLAIVQF